MKVNELQQVFIRATKVILVCLHKFWDGKLSVHLIDGHLCIDYFVDEVVQALIKLIFIFSFNHLDMLNEVGEVEADEVDPRGALASDNLKTTVD